MREAITSSVRLQRGTVDSVADTSISATEMNQSFGTRETLRVSARNEALLRFDLSQIPASAVINSATLALYLNGGDDERDDDCDEGSREGFPVVPIKIHRATASWNENRATYANFDQRFDPAVAGIIYPNERERLQVGRSEGLGPAVGDWVAELRLGHRHQRQRAYTLRQ